jgi:hypothetical protein
MAQGAYQEIVQQSTKFQEALNRLRLTVTNPYSGFGTSTAQDCLRRDYGEVRSHGTAGTI